MRIGVPKERKILEKRIALTPEGAKELRQAGHSIQVESGAGSGAGFSDDLYLSAGCTIAKTLKQVWEDSDLVVKVKEPHEEEYQYFRPGLIVFDYLHLAGLPKVAKVLLESKVSGVAYELVQSESGRLPLLEPMSEIAGKLSIINGSTYLLSQYNGRGVLIGGTSTVPAANVTVLGFGIAGQAAVSFARSMGANVTVVERKLEKRLLARQIFGLNISIVDSTPENILKCCKEADLLVGAVLVPGAAAPIILTRSIISQMKPGSVFVDISIDQGGCSETSRSTSLAEPTYVESGVTHYCVPNMPAQAPLTATLALTAETLPYLKLLADKGLKGAVTQSAELAKALNVHAGFVTCQATAQALGVEYKTVSEVL